MCHRCINPYVEFRLILMKDLWNKISSNKLKKTLNEAMFVFFRIKTTLLRFCVMFRKLTWCRHYCQSHQCIYLRDGNWPDWIKTWTPWIKIKCSVKLPTKLSDSGDRTDRTISNTPPLPKWSLIFVINISIFFQGGFRGRSGIKCNGIGEIMTQKAKVRILVLTIIISPIPLHVYL